MVQHMSCRAPCSIQLLPTIVWATATSGCCSVLSGTGTGRRATWQSALTSASLLQVLAASGSLSYANPGELVRSHDLGASGAAQRMHGSRCQLAQRM
jgi:hypothetical protein